MADDAAIGDALNGAAIFSDDEQRILELFDRLEKLQLEIALAAAMNKSQVPRSPNEAADQDEDAAEKRFLESRASYCLRNQVVQCVIAVNPTANAIHDAKAASPIERDLLMPLYRRDSEAIKISEKVSELHEIQTSLTRVETESITLARKNVELAAELIQLAEEINRNKKVPDDDQNSAAQIAQLEDEMRKSRRRWRILKGTTSAVVVGSGVDWARDDVLRDIVLDSE